jgi:chromosome partitioning protein
VTRILAVANQKGGVGKTTTALNLAIVLTQRHCRVLLVDLDPQASLSISLGIDPYRVERSSYSLLLYPEIPLTRVLKPFNSALALVPGSVDLANASIKFIQEGRPLDRLRVALRQSYVSFDYILIDTPPGLGVLSVIGLLAADEILIPAQCNHNAMLGIQAIQEVVKRVRESMDHPALKIVGILPTFYDSNAVFAPQILSELQTLLPELIFRTVVPYDANVADALYKGRVVVEYAPQSPGALAYLSLADEILAR